MAEQTKRIAKFQNPNYGEEGIRIEVRTQGKSELTVNVME